MIIVYTYGGWGLNDATELVATGGTETGEKVG
jgi:hypothetical protein